MRVKHISVKEASASLHVMTRIMKKFAIKQNGTDKDLVVTGSNKWTTGTYIPVLYPRYCCYWLVVVSQQVTFFRAFLSHCQTNNIAAIQRVNFSSQFSFLIGGVFAGMREISARQAAPANLMK